jgi:hypothetical protein
MWPTVLPASGAEQAIPWALCTPPFWRGRRAHVARLLACVFVRRVKLCAELSAEVCGGGTSRRAALLAKLGTAANSGCSSARSRTRCQGKRAAAARSSSSHLAPIGFAEVPVVSGVSAHYASSSALWFGAQAHTTSASVTPLVDHLNKVCWISFCK